MFNKKNVLRFFALTLVSALLLMNISGCSSKEEKWPTRPMTIVVFSAAGGGTDLACRALAAVMEKDLGQKINVVNMPATGAAPLHVMKEKHDGHTLLGLSEGMFPAAVVGAHESTSKDWEYFFLGGTPAVMSVRADSPYKTVEDVLNDMKARPGEVKLANSIVGCIWDIKAALLQQAADIKYKFMPYQGSNPSILAALSGEVDVVITGVGEQAEFLASKKLRPLAMIELEDMDVPGYQGVPSIVKTVPGMKDKLPVNQVVGFAVPSDVPKEVLTKLEESFKKAVQSEDIKKYAETAHLKIVGMCGKEAKDYVKKMESLFSWILYEKGVAKKSPEEFGIPKP